MKIYSIIVLVLFNFKILSQSNSGSISYNYLYITDSSINSKVIKEVNGYINSFGPISTFKIDIPFSIILKISLFREIELNDIKFEKLLFESSLDSGLLEN